MRWCAAAQPSEAARRHAQQQRILYQRGQQGGAFERVAPSKGESRRWERSGRFQKRVWAVLPPFPICIHTITFIVLSCLQSKHHVSREDSRKRVSIVSVEWAPLLGALSSCTFSSRLHL